MKPLLQARNLSRVFPRPAAPPLRVIDDISLTLNPGEIVCLLGASGSGKTTLLHMLAGLDAPDSGMIESDIKRPGPQIGYMSQGETLLPWRTALDNVTLGTELTGRGSRPQAQELLRQVGLEPFMKSHPKQLSGGMRQRVILARTLATEPKLLLMDEPMSNLDVLARRQMAGIVKNYVRQNAAAALVVTHSVEEACSLADRILLITRSPAVIYKELPAAHIALDTVMMSLLETLEGKRA